MTSFKSSIRTASRAPASVGRALCLGALLGAACLGTAAWAQPTLAAKPAASAPDPVAAKTVTVLLTQFKVVKNAKGVEQLVDAAAVKPGDVIEYQATYKNNSKQAVSGLVANLPIPAGLEYLPKSARPGAKLVEVATSNGQFAAEPLMRPSAAPGKAAEAVPYNEYRSVRWNLGQLPAGGEAAVTARARVEGAVAPASTAVSVPPASAAK